MSNLILLDDEDDTSVNLCKICTKSQGKYTCPRCGIGYCSLACYQSELHSECSEDFYRECVYNEMKLEEGNAEAEKKMKDILLRVQQFQQSDADTEELDSDDEFEPDLTDRMLNVNLDDPDSIWKKLTLVEKQEFKSLVSNGDASELLPTWKPWWNYRKEKKMVVVVECEPTTSTESGTHIVNCPPLKEAVQPLSQITKTQPADIVKFNVLNVLAAYCYVARWFNGEHQSLAPEAAQTLTTLSRNLSQGNNYASTELAIEAVALEATSSEWLDGSAEMVTVMRQDLTAILAGPDDSNLTFYLEAALSDVHALLCASIKSQAKRSKTGGEFSRHFPDGQDATTRVNLPRDKLKQCAKKMEYYLSWAKEHATEICCMPQKPASSKILTTGVCFDDR